MKNKGLALLFVCLIVLLPTRVIAAKGVDSLKLIDQSFDGMSLVYVYEDQSENEILVPIKVPLSMVDAIGAAADPVQEAKNQLMLAYKVYGLGDRIQALNNEYVATYNIHPTFDPNLKIKFQSQMETATAYANQNLASADKSKYDVIGDRLTPIPVSEDTSPAPTDDANVPSQGSDDGYDWTMIAGIAALVLVVITIVWVTFRKRGI
jgi:hypothetical protein